MKKLMMAAVVAAMGWAGPALAGSATQDFYIEPERICPDAAVCAWSGHRPVEADHVRSHPTSCREARKIVSRRGFHSINTERCGRSTHRFTAWRLGSIYRIKVSARSGRIISAEAFLLGKLRDQ